MIMKSFKHLDRIDAYLDGQMTEDDKQAFEAALQSDPELKAEWDACLAADSAIEQIAFRGLLKRTSENSPHANTGHREKHPLRRFKIWIGLVVVAAGMFWLLFPSENKNTGTNPIPVESEIPEPSPATMLNDSFLPAQDKIHLADSIPTNKKNVEAEIQPVALAKALYEPIVYGTRGTTSPVLSSMDSAMMKGTYNDALKLAENVGEGGGDYLYSRRIAGHAAFQLGKYEAAADYFQQYLGRVSPVMGKWEEGNLLLSMLAAGKSHTQEYKQLLEKIKTDEAHPFHEKSRELK